MGGGASSGGVEGLLATTLMVGRAIAGVYRNPGMYRIQDFHSEKAPRLKSAAKVQFAFFGQESDSDEEVEDDYEPPSPIEYEHMFNIEVSTKLFTSRMLISSTRKGDCVACVLYEFCYSPRCP